MCCTFPPVRDAQLLTREQSTLESFREASDDWRSLHARGTHKDFFLTWPWVDAWYREYAVDTLPELLLLRDEGQDPVGGCLVARTITRRAAFKWTCGYINTAGEPEAHSVVVEHNRLLCRHEDSDRFASWLAMEIRKRPFDELTLRGGVEADVHLLCRHLPDWHASIEWRPSPFVDLSSLRDRRQSHLDALSSGTRAQLRRSMRLYGERDGFAVEIAAGPDQALEWMEELSVLHLHRWAQRGEAGAFASPRRRRFLEYLVRTSSAEVGVHLVRVSHGARLIGMLLNFVANGHVSFYQSGFAYEADNRQKPGLVTHHLAIEHYRTAGYREYDFLADGPSAGRYKVSLSTDSRRLGWLSLVRPGFRSAAIRKLTRSWHGLATLGALAKKPLSSDPGEQ